MRAFVRIGTGVASMVGVVALGVTSPGPASAMGSGNPYEDLQVGVTYTVFQPTFTGSLDLTHTGSEAGCPAGTEQNMIATYGNARERILSLTEGNPLCSDPAGAGKEVATVPVQGAKAVLEVYCDPAIPAQWKACTRKDMARFGGSLTVTLPGHGKLRATDVVLVTYGAHPLTSKQLVKAARSLRAVAGDQQLIGGMVTCTQADFGDVIAAGLPKGEVLVSVDSFQCDSGWAFAFATLGDGKGHNIAVTDVFEAEGQFWIPKDRGKVCGTVGLSNPSVRPADSQVPAAIWPSACNTN